MKILDKAARVITKRKKRRFDELNNLFLAIMGILAFFIAGYWGLMLGEVVPQLIKVVNKNGISPNAIGLTLFLGSFGIIFWFFGCVAARCHSLLYERLFK